MYLNFFDFLNKSHFLSSNKSFLNELQNTLKMQENIFNLKNLPKDTFFVLDRYEGSYAVCECDFDKKMYNIPKKLISPAAKEGDVLKLNGRMYVVDSNITDSINNSIGNKFKNIF